MHQPGGRLQSENLFSLTVLTNVRYSVIQSSWFYIYHASILYIYLDEQEKRGPPLLIGGGPKHLLMAGRFVFYHEVVNQETSGDHHCL